MKKIIYVSWLLLLSEITENSTAQVNEIAEQAEDSVNVAEHGVNDAANLEAEVYNGNIQPQNNENSVRNPSQQQIVPEHILSRNNEASPLEPEIFAEIQQDAIENATKFDGVKGVIGIAFAMPKFDAGLENKSTYTSSSMNNFAISLLVEYTKDFKSGLLIGAYAGVDLSKKKKKDGIWAQLNSEYEIEKGTTHAGNKTGTLQTDAFSPNFGIKGGFIIKPIKSIVFAKIGMSRVGGKYFYKADDRDICNVGVGTLLTTIGCGIERKINNKWGIALEADISLQKNTTKKQDTVDHKIKVGRKDIRLMGTFNFSK